MRIPDEAKGTHWAALLGYTLDRRMLIRSSATLFVGSLLSSVLTGCRQGGTEQAAPATMATPTATVPSAAAVTPTVAQQQGVSPAGRRGGLLRVAIIGEPPALDPQFTTATVTANVTWHMFESLFTRDSRFSPIPMLAESWEFQDDNRVLQVTVRPNVKFHDGRQVTADDVVASLIRYSKLTPRGRSLFTRVKNLDKVDSRTVRLEFEEPTGIALVFLAQVDAMIIPKDLAEAYPDKELGEYIGTGPFKFKERLPDRYISLVRNDDYVPLDLPPDGYGGARVPYFDEIRFIPVPEQAVRSDGLVTDEFDFAEGLSFDNYQDLVNNPDIEVQVALPYYWYGAHMNKSQESIMSNLKLRHALLAAINVEPVARAGFSSPEFYRLYSSMSAPETPWHTEGGAEYYNQRNPEKARQLLQEAGYDGRPLRWIATKEYSWNYNMAVVLKQQLEAVGVVIDLQVMDWATLVRTRSQRDAWDIFITGHESYQHPALHPFMNPSWPGFWENERRDEIIKSLMSETDEKKISDLVSELDKVFWEDAVMIKVCEGATLRAFRSRL